MSKRTKNLKRILKRLKRNHSNLQYIKIKENGVFSHWRMVGKAKDPSGAQIYTMSMQMDISQCGKCGTWTMGKTVHSQEECNKKLTEDVVEA
jgi:hypothetical protein